MEVELEAKMVVLHNARAKAAEASVIIEELNSLIRQHFQVKIGTDLEQINGDIDSLLSFYSLLQHSHFPSHSPNSGFFSLLPAEVVVFIFSFLDANSLIKCRKINWEFRRLSQDNNLWRKICLHDKLEVFWRIESEPDWKEVWKWYYECEKPLEHNDSLSTRGCREIDGAIYKGEWKNRQKDGKGIQIWGEGDIYKGEWKQGKRTGRGIHIWPDGHYYEGSYDDDKRNGEGIFKWPDGREYRGFYVDDQRNGRGEFSWPNGDRYIGQYKSSNRNGLGVFTWHDGRKYDGEWYNGGYHGHGVYTHRDGCQYRGQWKDNMRHGKGLFLWADGDYFDGNWAEGKRIGKGRLYRKTVDFIGEEQTWNEEKFDKHNKGVGEDPLTKKRKLEANNDDMNKKARQN
eukprot:TRINITY_DN8849_c0_g1_i1.p1 TRINITY_DN8849_c0_g1~~TRINITY_DN8849_c0_g1_i1.p1  ORF type:complete len:399 (-),score=67.97 TRINITY_DN8849_c0_g1_i1:197-1393(-)